MSKRIILRSPILYEKRGWLVSNDNPSCGVVCLEPLHDRLHLPRRLTGVVLAISNQQWADGSGIEGELYNTSRSVWYEDGDGDDSLLDSASVLLRPLLPERSERRVTIYWRVTYEE